MRDKLGSDFFSAARGDKPGYRWEASSFRPGRGKFEGEERIDFDAGSRSTDDKSSAAGRCTPLIRLYTRRRGLATAPIYRRRYCSGAIVEFIPGEFAPRPRDADDESVARDVAGNFKRAPWISANWRDCVQGRTRLVR